MGAFSIWHWLVLIIYALVLGVPFARILRRAGYSRWFVIGFVIPVVNLFALWGLAFAPWPAIDKR